MGEHWDLSDFCAGAYQSKKPRPQKKLGRGIKEMKHIQQMMDFFAAPSFHDSSCVDMTIPF